MRAGRGAGVFSGLVGAGSDRHREVAAPASRVVIVLAPYLSWDDISAEKTPAIWSLLPSSAVGNMNAHTAEYDAPTWPAGVLTLSASRWAKAPDGGPLDAASLDRARAANAGSLSEPTFGSLGSAVLDGRAAAESPSAPRTRAPRRRPDDFGSPSCSPPTRAAPSTPTYPDVLATRSGRAVRASHRRRSARRPPSPRRRWAAGARGHRHRRPVARSRRDRHPRPARRGATPTRSARSTRPSAWSTAVFATSPSGDSMLMVVTPATEKEWYKAPAFGPLVISGAGFQGRDRLLVHTATGACDQPRHRSDRPGLAGRYGPRRDARQAAGSRGDAGGTAGAGDRAVARRRFAPGVIDQLRDAWVLRWFCYGRSLRCCWPPARAARRCRGRRSSARCCSICDAECDAGGVADVRWPHRSRSKWRRAATRSWRRTLLVALAALVVRRRLLGVASGRAAVPDRR